MNKDMFAQQSVQDILLAFFKGLRFDISSIILTNLLFIAIYFFPKPQKLESHPWYHSLLVTLLLLVNLPCLLMNIGDAHYFQYVGRRSSLDIFKIADDITGHMGSTLSTYIPSLVLFILVSFLFYKFLKKVLFNQKKMGSHFLMNVVCFLSVSFFVVLGARGGFQSKPLRPINAFVPEKVELGHLALNTTFTVIKSKLENVLSKKSFFSDQKVQEILSQRIENLPPLFEVNPKKVKPNIVIIALEGFSAKYVGSVNKGQGYTPFFDQLAKKGTSFRNHFANGRRSMQAFPALFLGLPSLGNSPLAISPYANNDFVGIATHLQNLAGYQSAFYHGANYNSSFTHSTSIMAGFEKVISGQEYPDQEHHNGHWGIDDGPYLQYYANELSRLKAPFVSAILTLSSHHPYSIPDEFEKKFAGIESPVWRSIRYTDKVLGDFFATAKKQPWYKNTLFVLTGDHTNQAGIFASKYSGVELFHVPMLLFSEHPDLNLPKGQIYDKITQHSDLPKTIYSLLRLSPEKELYFGNDMFSAPEKGEATIRSGQVYYLINEKFVVSLVSDSADEAQVVTYQRNNEFNNMPVVPIESNPAAKVASDRLKAYIQYYNNGMINNNLYVQ